MRALLPLTLAMLLPACSSSVTPPAATDASIDVEVLDRSGPDVVPPDGDAAPTLDAPAPPGCAPGTAVAAFERASDCSATAQPLDPAALCGASTGCPVAAHVLLRCSTTGGEGPWVVATHTGALVHLAANVGHFRNVLFTLPTSGAPEAPRLAPSRGAGRVAVDTAGRPIFLESEETNVATLHERDGVWRRSAAASGKAVLLATAGAFADEDNGYLVANEVNGRSLLITRRAGCWSTQRLPGQVQARPAVAIDRDARPWAAWWLAEGGRPILRLLAPDGRTHDVGTAPDEFIVGHRMPSLVADQSDGRSVWPALADIRADGLHVYTRGAAEAAWRDRLLVAHAARPGGDCPATDPPPAGDRCAGLTRCTEQVRSVVPQVGLARTGDGTLWAVWATHDYDVDYDLSGGGGPGCGGSGREPPYCACTRTERARRGGSTLSLARVTDGAITTVSRVRVAVPRDLVDLSVAARGDVVHLVVRELVTTETTLHYFAVDTRALRP